MTVTSVLGNTKDGMSIRIVVRRPILRRLILKTKILLVLKRLQNFQRFV